MRLSRILFPWSPSSSDSSPPEQEKCDQLEPLICSNTFLAFFLVTLMYTETLTPYFNSLGTGLGLFMLNSRLTESCPLSIVLYPEPIYVEFRWDIASWVAMLRHYIPVCHVQTYRFT